VRAASSFSLSTRNVFPFMFVLHYAMTFAAEMKEKKQLFLREMYTIAQGRFGVLIDSYDVGEKHGFDWETLETIVEYLEAKGLIASYEGTLYASLTLKGVERIESPQ
jgi:arginyl-tRNA synthetase